MSFGISYFILFQLFGAEGRAWRNQSLTHSKHNNNCVCGDQNSMAKHEELPIPIYYSLEPVYGEGSLLEEAKLRFDNLKSKFLQVFGHPPDIYARSPGRVNLIGEHIDYEGYSVLPMAIRQDTIVAIRKWNEGEAERLL
ncbi:hypothetical protein PTKIN_Ptkin16aG0072000 [Pterospermum kingtungense]